MWCLKESIRVFIQRKLSPSLQYLAEEGIGRVSPHRNPSYFTDGVGKEEEGPEETTNPHKRDCGGQ